MLTCNSTRLNLACVLLFVLVGAYLQVESLEYPQLSDILGGIGLGQQKSAINEREIKLVEELSKLYENNESLKDQEAAMLKNLGTAKPNPHQKHTLLAIYNMHLINKAKFNTLREYLRKEVEVTMASEKEVAEAA